jgi:hypothetical protein
MENENLKSAVLAKSGELIESAPSGIWQNEKATMRKQYVYWLELHDDTVRLKFDQSIPANCEVWPLAAQILGIAGKPEPEFDFRFHELTDEEKAECAEILRKAWEGVPKMTIEVSEPTSGYVVIEMPEPRPSDGLLWECWKEACEYDYKNPLEQEVEEDTFAKWLSTLPPDPLADDRAAIQNEFANGLERKLIDAYCTGDAIDAMKRFAGMEATNG